MKVIAYLYSNPLLEPAADPSLWGWEIDQIYQDLGGRQQLQQLFEDIQSSSIDSLLIRRLADLGDSVSEVSQRLGTLKSLGIQLVVIEAETHTADYSSGEQAELLNLLQELQQSQRSRQIRLGHARNRIKALPPPGKAPYGYRRGKDRYAIDRSAAAVVKDFFEHFLLYGSLRSAVRYLEKKHGKKISVSTGQRWLTNPVYRGDLAYQNNQVIANTHVAILSRQEAAQIDRLLRRNHRLPPRTASAPRSLAGLVVCGECQSPMTVCRVTTPRKHQSYLYLRPTHCPRQPKCSSIPYQSILEQTIQRICIDLPKAVAQMNMPDMDGFKRSFETQIAAKQDILDQLPDLTASGVLDPETTQLRTYKLLTEISELQGQLAQLPPVSLQAIAQTVSIPQFWLDLSEPERRFYFREFIQQIQLIRQDETWHLQLVFIF